MEGEEVLKECIGYCPMCKHAIYYEWATDINDFYCNLDENKIQENENKNN